jgi:hypothetical protein
VAELLKGQPVPGLLEIFQALSISFARKKSVSLFFNGDVSAPISAYVNPFRFSHDTSCITSHLHSFSNKIIAQHACPPLYYRPSSVTEPLYNYYDIGTA